MTKQKILLIGATGFAGNHVMQKLNNDFEVITLSRKLPTNLSNNTKNIIFDFYNLDNQTELPKSDHIILCIGTPLKLWELIYVKNKDMPAFVKVDKEYVITFAQAAYNSGIKNISIISAIGADSNSSNRYLRVKGEVEDAIVKIGFDNINIFRPSHICGRLKWEKQNSSNRLDMFIGEYASLITKPLMFGPLRDFKGIDVEILAQSITNNVNNKNTGIQYFTYDNFIK